MKERVPVTAAAFRRPLGLSPGDGVASVPSHIFRGCRRSPPPNEISAVPGGRAANHADTAGRHGGRGGGEGCLPLSETASGKGAGGSPFPGRNLTGGGGGCRAVVELRISGRFRRGVRLIPRPRRGGRGVTARPPAVFTRGLSETKRTGGAASL